MVDYFAEFPDSARVWIYAFDRSLTATEESTVAQELDAFLATWNSHGEPVKGEYFLLENRILIIAGQCADDISGCSIDSKVQIFRKLSDRHGLNSMGYDRVFYRDTSYEISSVTRSEFKDRLDSGLINSTTLVFDLTIGSVEELRKGRLEVPYTHAWHFSAFGAPKDESAIA